MNATSALAPARSASSMRLRNWSSSLSVKFDVLVLHRQVVDAALRRRDPGRHLARRGDFLHQRMDERAVRLGGDPFADLFFILVFRQHVPFRVHRLPRPGADGAAKARRGKRKAKPEAGALDLAVPALE